MQWCVMPNKKQPVHACLEPAVLHFSPQQYLPKSIRIYIPAPTCMNFTNITQQKHIETMSFQHLCGHKTCPESQDDLGAFNVGS